MFVKLWFKLQIVQLRSYNCSFIISDSFVFWCFISYVMIVVVDSILSDMEWHFVEMCYYVEIECHVLCWWASVTNYKLLKHGYSNPWKKMSMFPMRLFKLISNISLCFGAVSRLLLWIKRRKKKTSIVNGMIKTRGQEISSLIAESCLVGGQLHSADNMLYYMLVVEFKITKLQWLSLYGGVRSISEFQWLGPFDFGYSNEKIHEGMGHS